MKHKYLLKTSFFITLLSLFGCSSSSVSPSQNESLNHITPSGKQQKASYMQHSLDNWLKDEWEPTVQKDETIRQKYMKKKVIETNDANLSKKQEVVYEEDKEKGFTLQEYVDKAAAYQKAHPSDYEHSHAKEMESLPVIGK